MRECTPEMAAFTALLCIASMLGGSTVAAVQKMRGSCPWGVALGCPMPNSANVQGHPEGLAGRKEVHPACQEFPSSPEMGGVQKAFRRLPAATQGRDCTSDESHMTVKVVARRRDLPALWKPRQGQWECSDVYSIYQSVKVLRRRWPR